MSRERAKGRGAALTVHASATGLFAYAAYALAITDTLVVSLQRLLVGAACVFAALSFHALVRLGDRSLRPLPARTKIEAYLYVLITAGVLAFSGLHLLTGVEGASAAGGFCLLTSGWIAVLGLQLVPTVFIGDRFLLDGLWRVVPLSRLEWFSLRPQGVTPPRSRLLVGKDDVVRVAVQLVGSEHEALRRRLSAAGLRALQRVD